MKKIKMFYERFGQIEL